MADFLYDSSGDWIAWRRTIGDQFLFNDGGDAIGWFPRGDTDAVNMNGDYLGTVVGNRLLRKDYQPYRGYPGYPGYPGYAGYPGYPGYAGYFSTPSGFADVAKSQLKG